MELILTYAIGYVTGVLTALFIFIKTQKPIEVVVKKTDDDLLVEEDKKKPIIGFYS